MEIEVAVFDLDDGIPPKTVKSELLDVEGPEILPRVVIDVTALS
jgi:hypothetical protein